MSKNHMSVQDKKEFEELYEYVRKNIMGYDNNQSLSRDMVLRLKGLSSGKYMENNNVTSKAKYDYNIILLTFKYCSQNIHKYLSTNNFKDEQHKFNYILKIVENNINTVYKKIKETNKINKEVEYINVESMTAPTIPPIYNSKDKEEKNKNKYNDLW